MTCCGNMAKARWDGEAATLVRNFAYFDGRDIELDWKHRLILAARRATEDGHPYDSEALLQQCGGGFFNFLKP